MEVFHYLGFWTFEYINVSTTSPFKLIFKNKIQPHLGWCLSVVLVNGFVGYELNTLMRLIDSYEINLFIQFLMFFFMILEVFEKVFYIVFLLVLI